MPTPSRPLGLVLRVDAKVCQVELADGGGVIQVPLRGRLFEERGFAKNPVAVGDRVVLSIDDVDGGAIDEVLPRTSKLARRSKREEDREQVIAANVTLVLIVTSVREPPLQPVLIDRILASCERQSLRCAVALTKMDRDRYGEAAEWIELYRGLGYEVYPTSIADGEVTGDTLTTLGAMLHDNTTVLSGLSGVGKSTLINHLCPGLNLRIGSMNRILQGKHTTSHTQLIALPGGGHVLDTPGIRSFTLFGVDPNEVTFYFRELAPLARQCAFRDCSHLGEPECAVIAAVERGEVHTSRFASYAAIHEELSE